MDEARPLMQAETEQYERLCDLIRTKVVGAVPVLLRARLGEHEVAVICGHVDAQLTDSGKHELWPEAVLIDHLLAEQLVVDGEYDDEEWVNPHA